MSADTTTGTEGRARPGTDTDQPWVHYEEGQTQPQQSGLHY